ncbi:MAG: hypothetical protein D6790_13890 [Caldilineae bacterium]|nr:MAG: hypothetical protein D6790_13890 [Caldilineae bacterium]
MEGLILTYNRDTGEGLIRGDDGVRYRFSRADWGSSGEPFEGLRVDFVPTDNGAAEVYALEPMKSAVADLARDVGSSPKTIPAVIYALYLLAFLYGITMVVGVVLAYVNRPKARGTWIASHYDWQISTFWKSLIGVILGTALLIVWVGLPILLATYVWVIYRIVKGWSALSSGEPVGKKG